MAPVHFPTGSAYRLREHFCRHMLCPIGSVLEQGVTFSYHPEEWESSGMKNGGNEESGVKRRNEREAASIIKKSNWLR